MINLKALEENLKRHVAKLSTEIGERNFARYESLEAAADYVESELKGYSLACSRQEYSFWDKTFRNVVGELRGVSRPSEVLILGAHYDTAAGSPGADDNASGVAGMLELARIFSSKRPEATVRFAGFVNEEPPFFRTARMGSMEYAAECRRRGEFVRGAVILEMIGYYRDQEGSQQYPAPLSFFYPKKGNFIGVVGNLRSRGLVGEVADGIRSAGEIPVETLASFTFIPGVDFSDHRSFWKNNYHAVMVTDTAFYRNPCYHSPWDKPDTLDYGRMAKVVQGLSGWLERAALQG